MSSHRYTREDPQRRVGRPGPVPTNAEPSHQQLSSRPRPAGNLAHEVNIAELAVQRASLATKRVLKLLSSSSSNSSLNKQDNSPVTIADFAAQALLISGLIKAFPGDLFLGEESADALRDPKNRALLDEVWRLVRTTQLSDETSEAKLGKLRNVDDMLACIDSGAREDTMKEGKRYWVMDPVDGTSMFKKGGQYAIALALVQNGVELVGVTACPNLARSKEGTWLLSDSHADLQGYGWMLAASRGGGATVRRMGPGALSRDVYKLDRSNGKEPRTSSSGTPLRYLHFVDSMNSPKTLWQKVQKLAGLRESEYGASTTQLYSSHMRYVAMALGTRNFAQVRWPNKRGAKWSMWDHVGTPLIYTESGPGIITDMSGRPIRYDGGRDLSAYWGIITADSSIHRHVVAEPESAPKGIIAFWNLDVQKEDQPFPAPGSVQPIIRTSGVVDVLFPDEQPDARKPLFIRSGRTSPPSWTTATGWLLKNDIIVTAAHCVYDHDHDEHVTSIQAIVLGGSHGAEQQQQQTRSAKRVVVPREWTDGHRLGTTHYSKHNVALVCLERPFENVRPFAYGGPLGLGGADADELLTVVGYPADVRVGGMPGGGMYEMVVVPVVGDTADGLLRYRGDVQGGLSGAPVVRDRDFAVVGVHVSGGSWNSAVAIGGLHGIDLGLFEEGIRLLEGGCDGSSFDHEVQAGGGREWLCYVPVPRRL
ncbi:uncharacterized protein B0T15DRAFT_488201 [Chaetomium strumarium]|uniref:Serine protease n=1 Tax=Chaetomium strumarium TaxID=1170767 RepID=A0AAJ0H0B0_9PEZI|nr:hypothetical protein B0T15DRAFT_488201 [Chaetomium strumarium]